MKQIAGQISVGICVVFNIWQFMPG